MRPPTSMTRNRPLTSRRQLMLIPTLLGTLVTLTANADGLSAANPTAPTPIIVEADTFELHIDEEKAIWRGNVSASQGNYTFRTSQLILHLDQMKGASSDSGTSSAAHNNPARFYELSARKLRYDVAKGTMVGAGDSELRRGSELIRAEKIAYQVNTRVAHALPAANGRVLVRFEANPDMPVFPGVTPRQTLPAAGG